MELTVGLLVIGLAVLAVLRRAEVRLTLLLTALALGAIARHPEVIVGTFLTCFTREQFLVPIGCSLGFAYVLRQTECDRHLVHLLARPLKRVRFLLVPGVVVIAALVNVPVVSQLSTAVLAGSVLVPILRAARVSPVRSRPGITSASGGGEPPGAAHRGVAPPPARLGRNSWTPPNDGGGPAAGLVHRRRTAQPRRPGAAHRERESGLPGDRLRCPRLAAPAGAARGGHGPVLGPQSPHRGPLRQGICTASSSLRLAAWARTPCRWGRWYRCRPRPAAPCRRWLR
jgi:hypothetical protein